ncbi:MAG: putative metallopeptidase [Pyrinomonadaceae bacterium]
MTDKVFNPGKNAAHHQIEREYFLSLGAKQFSGYGAEVEARITAHEVEFLRARGFTHYRSRWGQTVPVTLAGLRSLNSEGRKESKRMGTEYANAPDVRRVARNVMNECHPHLHGARIDYVFVSKTDKEGQEKPIESKGKQQWGKARTVSGLNAYLAQNDETEGGEPFFVIEISAYAWKRLDEAGRVALVDHELTHCALNEDSGAPEIRPHDVEEFTEVIKRRGLWKEDVRRMVEVGAKQLALPTMQTDGKAAKKPAGKVKGKSASAAPAG